jgi:hypothetical protein
MHVAAQMHLSIAARSRAEERNAGGRRVLRCPRAGCGGRMFVVDIALDEKAAMCVLCARTLPVDPAISRDAA